jgi:hypothetical protein
VKLLRAWIFLSALVLAISLAVHLSTFLAIDPIDKFRGVMFVHIAIFPPFIAAILYANKLNRTHGYDQKRILSLAPRWMRVMLVTSFAYALINFALFFILSGGNSPSKGDGKFLMTQHGRVIREISETEFHRQQAYIARGFSGHWMMFSLAATVGLTGVLRFRQNTREIQ